MRQQVLNIFQIGTHDWNKFVKPQYLEDLAKKSSLKLNRLDGVKLDLLSNDWRISKDSSVNYISNFTKI